LKKNFRRHSQSIGKGCPEKLPALKKIKTSTAKPIYVNK